MEVKQLISYIGLVVLCLCVRSGAYSLRKVRQASTDQMENPSSFMDPGFSVGGQAKSQTQDKSVMQSMSSGIAQTQAQGGQTANSPGQGSRIETTSFQTQGTDGTFQTQNQRQPGVPSQTATQINGGPPKDNLSSNPGTQTSGGLSSSQINVPVLNQPVGQKDQQVGSQTSGRNSNNPGVINVINGSGSKNNNNNINNNNSQTSGRNSNNPGVINVINGYGSKNNNNNNNNNINNNNSQTSGRNSNNPGVINVINGSGSKNNNNNNINNNNNNNNVVSTSNTVQQSANGNNMFNPGNMNSMMLAPPGTGNSQFSNNVGGSSNNIFGGSGLSLDASLFFNPRRNADGTISGAAGNADGPPNRSPLMQSNSGGGNNNNNNNNYNNMFGPPNFFMNPGSSFGTK